MGDAFEIVFDHNDPKHHERLERANRELLAWARKTGSQQLIREETELRPGVFKVRFLAKHAIAAPRLPGDNLVLSRRQA